MTYTRADELGSSPEAANFQLIATAGGGSWHRPSRPRRRCGNEDRKFLWRIGKPLPSENPSRVVQAQNLRQRLRTVAAA